MKDGYVGALVRAADLTGLRAKQTHFPLKISLVYMLGTLVLFLLSPFSAQAENVPVLVGFILAASTCFAVGYHLSIVQSRRYVIVAAEHREVTPMTRLLVVASGCWFLLFSVASLVEYGATSVSDVIDAALNPSASYFAKFQIYEKQQMSGRTSLPIQISVLTGVLYSVLIPFTVYFWRGLGPILRVFAVFCALTYVAYFVFIGTQKGIGDLLTMMVAALAASRVLAGRSSARRGRAESIQVSAPWKRRGAMVCIVLLALGFVGYLANNQGDRIEGMGAASKFEPNPIVTSIFGEKFSRGLSVASFYPTNGYIGLSKNLGVPFVWAGGLGGAPAIASYKTQYLGGADPVELSYPARTEAITGWPAGQYWSTIYPWLASDLSFPGAALFMAIAGWFTARMWLGVCVERDPLSLVLFCQMALFLAYVPANNQLMTSRYTAIGFFTLSAVYVIRRLVGSRHTTTELASK